MTTDRKANRPPTCSACNAPTRWVDDAWVCTRCGAEWYPDHGEKYAIEEPLAGDDGS